MTLYGFTRSMLRKSANISHCALRNHFYMVETVKRHLASVKLCAEEERMASPGSPAQLQWRKNKENARRHARTFAASARSDLIEFMEHRGYERRGAS